MIQTDKISIMWHHVILTAVTLHVTTASPLLESTTTSTTTATTTTSTTTSSTTTNATTAPPTKNPGLPCACGIPPNPLRATELSHINNNPWTVAIISKISGKQYCSGAIINTLFIVTTKSCANSISTIQIRANAQDLNSMEVSRCINRNVVNAVTNEHLALLKMDNPISQTNWDGMRPACLPSYNSDFSGKVGVHSGYGNIYPSNTPSSIIKKTDGYWIWCTASSGVACYQPVQNEGFCGADIGGPIVTEIDGRQYLAGIALVDNGCSTSNGMLFQEAVEVSSYYHWIWDNSQDGRFCIL